MNINSLTEASLLLYFNCLTTGFCDALLQGGGCAKNA
jgi:hypothetical protein